MNIRKKSLFIIFTTTIICLLLVINSHINNIHGYSQAFAPLSSSFKDGGNIATSKYVYLTFDDGPTFAVTDALLDVLKTEKIKATFFVVGKEIEGKESILKRIYNEGHSIGLHTYSHDFKKIYRSSDEFISEMVKTSNKIQETTGFTPKVIRFPGGSSKRLSALTLDNLHKKNFKVYDWNVDAQDGINPNLSVSQLIKNCKVIRGNQNTAIILMHCNSNNKNTVKALHSIIKYYLESGYEFKAITEKTPEYYYRFRK